MLRVVCAIKENNKQHKKETREKENTHALSDFLSLRGLSVTGRALGPLSAACRIGIRDLTRVLGVVAGVTRSNCASRRERRVYMEHLIDLTRVLGVVADVPRSNCASRRERRVYMEHLVDQFRVLVWLLTSRDLTALLGGSEELMDHLIDLIGFWCGC